MPVKREAIDEAAWSYFEAAGLDVEATRAAMAERHAQAAGEVRALLAQAQAEEQRAVGRLERVRREFTDGNLTTAEWRSFEADLSTERDAACAEAKRLSQQEADIAESAAMVEGEDKLIGVLAELRAAFAGKISGSADVKAARAALASLFERFTLLPADHPSLAGKSGTDELAVTGGYVIAPVPREDAAEAVSPVYAAWADPSDALVPILKRIPLGTTDNDAFTR